MQQSKAQNVDDYIAGFPAPVQKKLKEMRAIIRKAAPMAEEGISYAIPAFKWKGNLAFFAAFKNHISFYPAPRGNEKFEKALSAYKGGKGTVQFPLDKPLPASLITRMVKFRIQDNRQREEARLLRKAKGRGPQKSAKK